MRTAVVAILLVLGVFRLGPLAPDDPAGNTPTDDEARFVELLNEARAGVGLPPLQVDAELTERSRDWSEAMRAAGDISHAERISTGLTSSWRKVGENVGTGRDVEDVMEAFLASPAHHANIVDPVFTHVGVAVVWDGERLYTTQRFMSLEPAPAVAGPA